MFERLKSVMQVVKEEWLAASPRREKRKPGEFDS
jgi:hypothetical protein